MTSSTFSLYILNRNYSTWSLRAWFAMAVSKIPFTTIPLLIGTPQVPDLGSPEANEMLSQAGPTSKAPALHVKSESGNIHVVFESLAIMEYLAEEYTHLWPSDRFERAYARSLAAEMATGFSSIKGYSMNLRQRYDFDPTLYTDNVDKELRRLCNVWEELRTKAKANNDLVQDEGYLFGRFSALDAMYAPVMQRLRTYSLFPKVEGKNAITYVHFILNNEHMKEWEILASNETAVVPMNEVYRNK